MSRPPEPSRRLRSRTILANTVFSITGASMELTELYYDLFHTSSQVDPDLFNFFTAIMHGDDTINGSDNGDDISSGRDPGNDTIFGNGGDDFIKGFSGNDMMDGGGG